MNGAAVSSSVPTVEIALATYNGARFIDAQLDSYVAQTFSDWGLVVRDDGSTDDTVARIREHAARHGYSLRFTPDSGERLGYPNAFHALLERTGAPYVFLSDQDDVWLPDKIATCLTELRRLPADRPALVHTDLRVVDSRLEVLHDSYLRLRRSYPPRSESVLGLLCWEYVTGCTIGVNARARELFRRPTAKAGHDAWLALTCAALGIVRYLDSATILYRQHGNNVVGAHFESRPQARFWQRSLAELEAMNRLPLARAESLLSAYAGILPSGTREDLEAFAKLDEKSPAALLWLREKGALPAHPDTRRRVVSVLVKMQIKEKAFRMRSAFVRGARPA